MTGLSTLAVEFTERQLQIWHNLQEFSFDADGSEKPFSQRLADENGWTDEFAGRVLGEYRRFLFLTVVVGHVVCPSEEVDTAWHQHLIYSRSYWNDLCHNVLDFPLHHNPTRGGRDESRKHWEMYRTTLASYRKVFGSVPPADIWPPALDRFDPNSQARNVNLRDHWIIRKPRWWPTARYRKSAYVSALVPIAAVGLNPFDLPGPTFLILFALLSVLTFVGTYIYTRIQRDIPINDERDLRPEEVACLNFGRPTAVNVIVAQMLQEQELTSTGTKGWFGQLNGANVEFGPGENQPAVQSSFRSAIYNAVNPNPLKLRELQTAVADQTEAVESGLISNGYILDPSQRTGLRLFIGGIGLLLLVIGITKIVVGLHRDRPVGFLVMECLAVFVTSLILVCSIRRSVSGDRMIAVLRSQHQDLKTKTSSGDDIALGAALFGVTALAAPEFEYFKSAWKRSCGNGYTGNASSGCGGGAGCGGGGGGCGGGGGGCGGCGGG